MNRCYLTQRRVVVRVGIAAVFLALCAYPECVRRSEEGRRALHRKLYGNVLITEGGPKMVHWQSAAYFVFCVLAVAGAYGWHRYQLFVRDNRIRELEWQRAIERSALANSATKPDDPVLPL